MHYPGRNVVASVSWLTLWGLVGHWPASWIASVRENVGEDSVGETVQKVLETRTASPTEEGQDVDPHNVSMYAPLNKDI